MSFNSYYIDPSIIEKIYQVKYDNTESVYRQQKLYKHPIPLFLLILCFPLTMILSIIFFIRMTQIIGLVPNKKINTQNKKKYSKELNILSILLLISSLMNMFLLLIAKDDFHDITPYFFIVWIILTIIPVIVFLSNKNLSKPNILIVFLWLQFLYFIFCFVVFVSFFLFGWHIIKKYT